MARRHDEPVEVRSGAADGGAGALTVGTGPRSFVWRGRRYTVCAVLDTWQERRAWWREVGEHPAGAPDTERRVWRVEARPPAGTPGVFDLGRDDDHWLLLRAHD
ncbi:hypothetical protein JQN72_07145 [Phycicoccus sp. CSK15P-2]|uniref:DUF6504 family protein n=1 Tax=Phycicoccus sp. CSK15P-2 TaxID=2807627 RepID=UPI00194F36E8|nr:DUF6504 family protein [Phycicoccus sp. CSK15P-2]MBM6404016.1 hypothetical protein [Phycicoccus sp. CSK15P-2]